MICLPEWLSWNNAIALSNTTFTTSLVGALAGAYAGAYAAQRIAERSKERKQLLTQIRNCNAAKRSTIPSPVGRKSGSNTNASVRRGKSRLLLCLSFKLICGPFKCLWCQ